MGFDKKGIISIIIHKNANIYLLIFNFNKLFRKFTTKNCIVARNLS